TDEGDNLNLNTDEADESDLTTDESETMDLNEQSDTEEGSSSESGEQNLFSGRIKEDIFLVADNENNEENTGTQDIDAAQEIVTEATDQNGSNEPEEATEPIDQNGSSNLDGSEPADQNLSTDSGIGVDLNE